MINIAINGFGRIGKNVLRAFLEDESVKQKINIAVINLGKGDIEAAAFAFKYDTLMGKYPGKIEYKIDKNQKIIIDNHEIEFIAELNPDKYNWDLYDIDWVIDCTGKFTKREDAEKHLKAGAKRVLISAPTQDEDITIIPGVNSEDYNFKEHKIVSLGSCTTNAVAIIIKILNNKFGIKSAFLNTVHAYTNTQALLDVDSTVKDLRKQRAAALNIIPSTTGAVKVLDKIFPELSGKLNGIAVRVPVSKVSLIDLTVLLKSDKISGPVTAEKVNQIFSEASQEDNLKNILEFTTEPLVSSDYFGNSHSVIIDGLLTQVCSDTNLIKVFGWYDNEWAYSVRLKDFLLNSI